VNIGKRERILNLITIFLSIGGINYYYKGLFPSELEVGYIVGY